MSTDAQTGLADQRQSIMLGGGGIGGGSASTVLTSRPRATAGVSFGGNVPLPQVGNILSLHSFAIGQLDTDIQNIVSNMSSPFMMDNRVINAGGQGPDMRGFQAGEGMLQLLPQMLNQSPLRPLGFAAGGYVSPAAGVDSVPAMLTGGEFVMNAGATQRIGRGDLAALNGGGGVGEGSDAVVARLDELIAVSGEGGDTVINITVNSDGTQTTEGEGDTDQQTLALRIRDVVRQTIDEEKRLGGSLRRQ